MNLIFETISDEASAKKIWDELSPHEFIDDEWDFRYTFFKPLGYKLHFIVGFENDNPVTLLALQENNLTGLRPPYGIEETKPFLEFFGGDDTDDNRLLAKNPTEFLFRESVFQIKQRAYLAPLAPEFETFPNATWYENKYFVDISNYKSYEDFLVEKWSSGSRKKILQQIRKIEREHEVEVIYDDVEDIELLSKFNLERFGEGSSFSFSYRKEIFKELAKLYPVIMISLKIDGKKVASSFGLHYKDTYVGMNAGVSSEIPDLPKMLTLLQMGRAIELGCKVYDAGKGDSGWKENFHFSKNLQFKLITG